MRNIFAQITIIEMTEFSSENFAEQRSQLTVFGSQNVIFYGLFLVSQESFLNRKRKFVFWFV